VFLSESSRTTRYIHATPTGDADAWKCLGGNEDGRIGGCVATSERAGPTGLEPARSSMSLRLVLDQLVMVTATSTPHAAHAPEGRGGMQRLELCASLLASVDKARLPYRPNVAT
jgi:hypothetical protein